MDKKIIGLVGVVAAFAVPEAAQALPAAAPSLGPAPSPSVTEVLSAQSYAQLLDPIPDAATVLRAVDKTNASKPASVEKVQYYGYGHHHHHYHHHHHHGPAIVTPFGTFGVNGYHPPHHHHHHHHHYYDNGYED